MTLRRSTDRKTANLSSPNGKTPKIANAFGLPSGSNFSCPGMTSICGKVCYAGKLEKLFPGFRNVMLKNWDTIRNASFRNMVIMLSDMMREFSAECDRLGADKVFRIHHDGDFFSRDYAQAWATVVTIHSDIHFWVYTRSFTLGTNVLDLISGIPNLSVYLSVDTDNRQFVDAILGEYPDTRIATLAQTAADAADIIRDIRDSNRPGAICPENVKKIPLITTAGGACFTCDLCVHGKADVRFSISKA